MLVFDLETNGLLDTVSKLHCAAYNKGDNSILTLDVDELLAELDAADCIAGHNILFYDLPVLKKLYGYEYKGEVLDTMVASRVIWPDMLARDVVTKRVKGKLTGRHSLEAWGIRLGLLKGTYGQQENAWEKYTPEMGEYCKLDVDVNKKLLDLILKKQFPKEVLQMEQDIDHQLRLQQERGWTFDVAKAGSLAGEVQQRLDVVREELVAMFDPTIIELKTKTKVIPFNPGSRQQIGDRLMKMGWNPVQFTANGSPKVDEAVLATLDYKGVDKLIEYMMLGKRIGQIANGKEAWLKWQVDGKLHGRCDPMGTVTSRCSHSKPNLGQVPATGKEYGKECRELFTVPNGYKLVGADASGLELRCLAHYMHRWDKGAYGDVILNGDIHTQNMEAAGLPERNMAKTFIYGYLYGAGDGKIGQIVGGTEKEGKRLKAAFLKKTPALKKLKEGIDNRLKQQSSRFKTLKGLDGRLIPVRHKHAALNTLLQSAGAIICKMWYLEIEKRIREAGYSVQDAHIVGFIHDEVQIQVREGYADAIGKITGEAIKQVETDVGFKVPLDAEYQVGTSWAETH